MGWAFLSTWLIETSLLHALLFFQGDILYINLVENKSALAVGIASQSSEDLYMQGMHGKAVNVLHFVGK